MRKSLRRAVYAGNSKLNFKNSGGIDDVEVHGPCRRHDVRYVREPCERRSTESLSGKKVTSSRSKRETVVLSETELDEEALRSAISATGYEAGEIRQEPWEKKGLFSR